MTAPRAVYVTCPCGGRAEVDPSNPSEGECEICGWEADRDITKVYEALSEAGYSHSDRHGWRTDADIQDDSWNCECEDCHPGVERMGRWE